MTAPWAWVELSYRNMGHAETSLRRDVIVPCLASARAWRQELEESSRHSRNQMLTQM